MQSVAGPSIDGHGVLTYKRPSVGSICPLGLPDVLTVARVVVLKNMNQKALEVTPRKKR